MKLIQVMYDSLNRHMLRPYGCDWTETPNFQRVSERCATFDHCYIGSMPCMPARRELHTGRHNFLHRSWGPLEPFDDSTPELLKRSGVYTHLVSDHYHYWEDGGATYHQRYNTWEIVRGQEGDLWKGEVADPASPEHLGQLHRQDWINRKYMQAEEKTCQARTFRLGLEFLRENHREDKWFLQIETFDPHEPFFTLPLWKARYPHEYTGPHFDWPRYERVTESPDAVRHLRYEYAALLTQCDHYLGTVLDAMDELGLWEDTMLIVNTDHGFLLSEHDWWAKCRMPFYNEIANIPLFVWDPRSRARGVRRKSLVQTIDLPATMLEYFGVERPKDMQGAPLRDAIASDSPVRQAAIYGQFGGHVNVTDGRYVYMRGPATLENRPLFEYTHMPTHMRGFFGLEALRAMELAEPFPFTKGCRTMKVPARPGWFAELDIRLYDLESDAGQLHPIRNDPVEQQMIAHMVRIMAATSAPAEQYQRLGLPLPSAAHPSSRAATGWATP
ncbi:MAG TPA: sulfatase [Polyangiaceae bacterium]|jgi:arylsulfatase A-like enzyme